MFHYYLLDSVIQSHLGDFKDVSGDGKRHRGVWIPHLRLAFVRQGRDLNTCRSAFKKEGRWIVRS